VLDAARPIEAVQEEIRTCVRRLVASRDNAPAGTAGQPVERVQRSEPLSQ
jgi:hypothetical protein